MTRSVKSVTIGLLVGLISMNRLEANAEQPLCIVKVGESETIIWYQSNETWQASAACSSRIEIAIGTCKNLDPEQVVNRWCKPSKQNSSEKDQQKEMTKQERMDKLLADVAAAGPGCPIICRHKGTDLLEVYSGAVSSYGMREGQGKAVYLQANEDYESYHGGWLKNEWHGKGTAIARDGKVHAGQWKARYLEDGTIVEASGRTRRVAEDNRSGFYGKTGFSTGFLYLGGSRIGSSSYVSGATVNGLGLVTVKNDLRTVTRFLPSFTVYQQLEISPLPFNSAGITFGVGEGATNAGEPYPNF